MSYLVIAVGMIFVLEGLVWALAPEAMLKALVEAKRSSLRIYGVLVAVMGGIIMWYLLPAVS